MKTLGRCLLASRLPASRLAASCRPPAPLLRRAASTSATAAADAAAAGTTAAGGKSESTTTRVVGTVLFSSLVGYTAYLCSWQLNRYQWKVALVQQRTERVHGDPRPLAELAGAAELADAERAAAATEAAEFCRVTVRGEFDHAQQMLLGPRSAPPGAKVLPANAPGGAPTPSGWDVVTPLRCEDGTTVLVNRGWVPRDSTGALGQPSGVQAVHGVLKRGEERNKYAQNDPAARRYVWLDLPSMAAACESAPLLVVAAAPPGQQPLPGQWPMERPLEAFLDFYVSPSTHLVRRLASRRQARATLALASPPRPPPHAPRASCWQVYAGTWASLTVAGAFMTYKRFR